MQINMYLIVIESNWEEKGQNKALNNAQVLMKNKKEANKRKKQ